MNRLSVLGLAVISVAALGAACKTTKVVEQYEPAPAGSTPTGQNPGENPGENPAGTEDPLKDLAPDWKDRTGEYLTTRANMWLDSPPDIANIKCAMSCHTTFPTLLARGALGIKISAADDARKAFEARVTEAKAGTATPFYGKGTDAKTKESAATESVLNAVSISLDDLAKGATVSPAAKGALDEMWAKQGTDGSWDWLEFGLDPWETRNDWGTAMAALVAGSIPANTTASQAAGTTKIKGYITKNLKTMALHDRVTVLWASGSLTGLLTETQQEEIATELIAKQKTDGGFALPAWGKGDLAKASAKSDGYATALATLALCKGTTEGASRPEAIAGLKWLAAHQAADGSWPGQSVNSTTERAKGFMTDAATAYASLAITGCVAK